MRLLESYSRSISVPINHKPKLYEKYFPLNIGKYITLQTKSGMNSKDYLYFQEVIDILLPFLNKENINILHLGQDSQKLNGTINLNNQTSIGQASYIIKKSLLHLGVDSWMAHYACAEEIPCVSLYGATTVANHSPYHFNPSKSIFLESHRNNNKASFAREENPRSVDFIKPEKVASSVCKLLNIPFDYPYETLFIGSLFNIKFIESLPDSMVNISNLGIDNLIVRMDIVFNEQNLVNQLNLNKCSILTNKPINLDIIKNFKPRISEVVYFIEEDNKPEFAHGVINLRVPLKLATYLPPEKINNYKLDYIDDGIINQVDCSKPKELENISEIHYKTNKFLLSRGKIYPSRVDYLNERSIPNFESTVQLLQEKNSEEIWKDKDCILFLKKN